MDKKFVCMTTINEPTEAVDRFSKMPGWTLVVAGDRQTPHSKYLNRGNLLYLTPSYQKKMYNNLSKIVGWNCYSRIMFAVLEAYRLGADIIALVDDDTLPKDGWGKNLLVGKSNIKMDSWTCRSSLPLPLFDPFYPTDHEYLWHRGFPIQLVHFREYERKKRRIDFVHVQSDFVDIDLDVDVIARIAFGPKCEISSKVFPFTTDILTIFGSKNTFIHRSVVKDYFIFPFVGRMGDIWASMHISALGYNIVYNRPSAVHRRITNNMVDDLMDELLGYYKNIVISGKMSVSNGKSLYDFLPTETLEAFNEYKSAFVC